MKRFSAVMIYGLISLLLVGCAAGPIQPGDRVGKVLVDQAKDEEFKNLWDIDCQQQGDTDAWDCTAEVGTKVIITPGIYNPDPSRSLDEIWADFTYELSFGDRQVDLPAFDTIEIVNPHVGAMRMYNVAISSDEPTSITWKEKSQLTGEDPEESTTTLTFEAEQ